MVQADGGDGGNIVVTIDVFSIATQLLLLLLSSGKDTAWIDANTTMLGVFRLLLFLELVTVLFWW